MLAAYFSHRHLDGSEVDIAVCGTVAAFHQALLWLLQVFFIFAVVTNLLVSTSMLQGCVAVVNALTGVNIYGEHRSLRPSRSAQQAHHEVLYTPECPG